jgi:beta-N-acetylhexosaminidase
MGFKGLIISDSLDMAGALKSGNIADAAARALSSGVDMVLTSKRNPELTHRQIMAQINKTIPRRNIEDAAKKIFELKRDIGLFEESKERVKINSSSDAFNHFADKITREAVTIVKAEGGVLPYTKTPAGGIEEKHKKVCTIFFSPSRFADQLPAINAPFLEKGWKADYYNARMRPGQGDNVRVRQCVDDADLVLLGSMQWADKPIASQRAAIRKLLKSDKDIILLSLMSPYDIKFYPEAKNIIALYGANKLSAHAAADIILGNIEAKGRLPVKI